MTQSNSFPTQLHLYQRLLTLADNTTDLLALGASVNHLEDLMTLFFTSEPFKEYLK